MTGCEQIEASDVGPLLKIRVGHDGKGSFAGWFLEKVIFFLFFSTYVFAAPLFLPRFVIYFVITQNYSARHL